jgi:hypothetical protein
MSIETLKQAYLAGFMASGEGYNGEYPFQDNERNPEDDSAWCQKRDNALRTAIEQAEKQEPYGYFRYDMRLDAWVQNRADNQGVAFYTTPPAAQRQWVGLTDEEIMELLSPLYSDPSLVPWAIEVSMDEYRAIEAKLREKNGGAA